MDHLNIWSSYLFLCVWQYVHWSGTRVTLQWAGIGLSVLYKHFVIHLSTEILKVETSSTSASSALLWHSYLNTPEAVLVLAMTDYSLFLFFLLSIVYKCNLPSCFGQLYLSVQPSLLCFNGHNGLVVQGIPPECRRLVVLTPGQVTAEKFAVWWLLCQTPGAVGSVFGLVCSQSKYCHWMR